MSMTGTVVAVGGTAWMSDMVTVAFSYFVVLAAISGDRLIDQFRSTI
jgi:hypothetical protein